MRSDGKASVETVHGEALNRELSSRVASNVLLYSTCVDFDIENGTNPVAEGIIRNCTAMTMRATPSRLRGKFLRDRAPGKASIGLSSFRLVMIVV